MMKMSTRVWALKTSKFEGEYPAKVKSKAEVSKMPEEASSSAQNNK